ncbi:hypothetical protein SMX72_003989 [Cronobacter sakazakii]|nr:hypothetical protein [Cronobacter sakazakii]
MKKISNSYVSMVWQSLAEDPNMDSSFIGLNLSNEESLDLVLKGLIKPSYDNLPPFIKDRCKNSFAYAISFYDEKQLKRLYESAIPVFDPPSKISMREFYIIVWDILFPGEDFMINNPDDYIEVVFSDLYKK